MRAFKHNRLLRRAVERPLVQTLFHGAGGLGLGLLVAPLLQPGPTGAVGILLLAAAILGHWYAVWSDPGQKR
ncbi:MAG: hypothetical protein HYY02_00160 [Chloroflexi bacterium]|nr:hypothetical protein [Chloroflexota bacterium]